MNEQLASVAARLAAGEMLQDWQTVASSVNARVAFNREGQIYYKEFLPRGPLETVKAWFRGSRATRARQQNDRLLESGFKAPENIAWGKLPGNREYLFSTSVPGEGVTTWLTGALSDRQGETLALRRQLLRQLGTFIGKMHAAGFVHGDLRTSNVIADQREDGFTFSLIDNERNSCQAPAPGRGILRNLMQLNMQHKGVVSRTDRMRFFVYWRREMTVLNEAEAKLIALESWRWAMRRLDEKGLL